MTSRPALPVRLLCAACALLVPLTGCGGGESGHRPVPSRAGTSAAPEPGDPAASRAPAPGKGSRDPDDINGDGHRDLVVPVFDGTDPDYLAGDQRIAVIYGSAKGLDPSTRTVLGRRDLGLPEPPKDVAGRSRDSVSAYALETADLDGDGYPDFVDTVTGEVAQDRQVSARRTVPYVTWGSAEAPTGETPATPVTLPFGVSALGLDSLVRGDFDGDGHHDLAGLALNRSSMVVLYGPFTRSGDPARTDTSLPWTDGHLTADAVDPSGKTRATSLLVHRASDGEQSGNTLYRARPGSPLPAHGTELRRGGAHAFGDFDGDGRRDVAVGDDGSRNDEPGYETEPPEVDGSLAVYPGSGAEAVTHRLPRAPKGAATDYGPGGFVAADPDGDGRDGILVATYEGATLIDGDRRTDVRREGPARADGGKIRARWRRARPVDAADFDGDGHDELVLAWAADALFGFYGENPTHWWITDGTTDRDRTSFRTTGFAGPAG
ncbi:FG-GAP repeat domain-containing protein [Streptomyces sp. NPDC008313]|uniref:FG-GAP repeat domain-containing protein n=1 Tax=Streptomyces sp. NPDC008313 TaxID=3364826 RepID=UPI0036E9E27A